LLCDHAEEQCSGRELPGVRVPGGVRVVAFQARDGGSGYGDKTAEVLLSGRS
jgi:hypothetical protein